MESFQKIVLFAAVIILIITLCIIGYTLHYANKGMWPPITPQCPDWWVIDSSGNTCKNVKNLGKCPNENVMDFNKSPFIGNNGLCAKYKWANNCNISWDGVTYGINNPCNRVTNS